MRVLNNTPRTGCITWRDVTVTFDGKHFPIVDGQTSHKYVWVRIPDKPARIEPESGNRIPQLRDQDLVLFTNREGHAIVGDPVGVLRLQGRLEAVKSLSGAAFILSLAALAVAIISHTKKGGR